MNRGDVSRGLAAVALIAFFCLECLALLVAAGYLLLCTLFPWGPNAWNLSSDRVAALSSDYNVVRVAALLLLVALASLFLSVLLPRLMRWPAAITCVVSSLVGTVMAVSRHAPVGLMVVAAGAFVAFGPPLANAFSPRPVPDNLPAHVQQPA